MSRVPRTGRSLRGYKADCRTVVQSCCLPLRGTVFVGRGDRGPASSMKAERIMCLQEKSWAPRSGFHPQGVLVPE